MSVGLYAAFMPGRGSLMRSVSTQQVHGTMLDPSLPSRGPPMPDVVFVLLILALLLATVGFIRICDLLAPREQRSIK